MTVVEDRTLVN